MMDDTRKIFEEVNKLSSGKITWTASFISNFYQIKKKVSTYASLLSAPNLD